MSTLLQPGAFYGETVSLRIADAVLSEVRHRAAKIVPTHRHEAAYFSLLLEGSYQETAHDSTIVYEPFTFVFHQAQMQHTDSIGPGGCRMFMIELLPSWTSALREFGPLPAHVFELHGGEPGWLALRIYDEFLSGDAAAPLTVESLLFELCGHLAGRPPQDAREPEWLSGVDASLQTGFVGGLDVAALAADAGISPAHLCKTFRRFRGRSMGDYVMGLRLQLVCRRLVETTDELRDIAADAGFTDQRSHDARVRALPGRIAGRIPGPPHHRHQLDRADPSAKSQYRTILATASMR
ncbi:MAG: hypothetical protein DLM53_06350 [Candidatus Eremiobacter antarcticus]|nr:AraC family transcriptional regulator [Candidatus Eremiobacteraeota bacterium]MBC5807128.1 AraC family transcriptional regulator [Candidatus Eremiobacteraeota bacterium]PZR62433.1 MAG: hypothetical protein DLM53_06350 [Candidatus Eremiobacter sp. RRmetagenome_bin22]